MRFIFKLLFTLLLGALVFSAVKAVVGSGQDLGALLADTTESLKNSITGVFATVFPAELPDSPPEG